MKISVLIPSCGRDTLSTVIGSMHMLASKKNEIRYCIGLDEPIESFRTPQGSKVSFSISPRPNGLGAIYNRLAAESPADMYCLFADDIIPLTVGWDEVIAIVHKQAPHNIMAWFDTTQAMMPTYPIVPHSWYALNNNKIFTDYFPYWFDDTWLAEVYKMATGNDILIPKQLMFGGEKGNTNNMRELPFWWQFFSRTRKLRMDEAKALHDKAGCGNDFSMTCQEVIRAGLDRDNDFRKRLPAIEAAGGTLSEPRSEYLAAKSRAQQILVDMGFSV